MDTLPGKRVMVPVKDFRDCNKGTLKKTEATQLRSIRGTDV
jgi:hypothetical protein